MAYIGTWALLLWAKSLLAMQFMQFVYGVATSTEVAYYTYIYAKVSIVTKLLEVRSGLRSTEVVSGLINLLKTSLIIGTYEKFLKDAAQ